MTKETIHTNQAIDKGRQQTRPSRRLQPQDASHAPTCNIYHPRPCTHMARISTTIDSAKCDGSILFSQLQDLHTAQLLVSPSFSVVNQVSRRAGHRQNGQENKESNEEKTRKWAFTKEIRVDDNQTSRGKPRCARVASYGGLESIGECLSCPGLRMRRKARNIRETVGGPALPRLCRASRLGVYDNCEG